MTDMGTWLRSADPLRGEPQRSPADVQAMRRTVVAAVAERGATTLLWPRPLAIAATIALTLAAGIIVGPRLPPPPAVPDSAPQASDVRQQQFATPGGTRIIWTFTQDFEP